MRRSSISYFLCYLNVFCCVIFAAQHDLPFLLISFFFAVWNWYVAEAQRGIENEKNKDGESSDSSGDSNSSSEDEE